MSTPDPQRVRDPASDQRSPGPYPPQSSPPRGHPVPLSPRSLPQHITFLLSVHSQAGGRWATRAKEPGRQRGVGGNHTRQILEALREKQPEQTMAGADGLRRESGKEGGGSPIREQKVGTWQSPRRPWPGLLQQGLSYGKGPHRHGHHSPLRPTPPQSGAQCPLPWQGIFSRPILPCGFYETTVLRS